MLPLMNWFQPFSKQRWGVEAFEKSVSHMTCLLATVTIVTGVNIMALVWVKVKDKVLIDKMVTLDCVANIMMVGVLLLAFPVRIWNNVWLCAGITFFRSFTATLNRWFYSLIQCNLRTSTGIKGFFKTQMAMNALLDPLAVKSERLYLSTFPKYTHTMF